MNSPSYSLLFLGEKTRERGKQNAEVKAQQRTLESWWFLTERVVSGVQTKMDVCKIQIESAWEPVMTGMIEDFPSTCFFLSVAG